MRMRTEHAAVNVSELHAPGARNYTSHARMSDGENDRRDATHSEGRSVATIYVYYLVLQIRG